jgi:hypothetical protein
MTSSCVLSLTLIISVLTLELELLAVPRVTIVYLPPPAYMRTNLNVLRTSHEPGLSHLGSTCYNPVARPLTGCTFVRKLDRSIVAFINPWHAD